MAFVGVFSVNACSMIIVSANLFGRILDVLLLFKYILGGAYSLMHALFINCPHLMQKGRVGYKCF